MTEEQELELTPQMASALSELFELANIPVPNNITPQSIQAAIVQLKNRLAKAPLPAGKKPLAARREKNVLVAGFMGIINLQLKQILTRVGASVEVADSVPMAVDIYQNTDIDVAIIDISSPNEKAGFRIVEEVKRLSVVCNMQTQIVVLGQPSKTSAMEQTCKALGATAYIEKDDKWQERVLENYLQ